jgi:hypothetical protein
MLWGFGLIFLGFFLFSLNYVMYKQLNEQLEKENPTWTRFLFMFLKIDTLKSFFAPIVFILIGILLILGSLGVF